MCRAFLFAVVAICCSAVTLQGDDNFCRKCEVLREYHRENPSKYEYHDDYVKDVEERGVDAVTPSPEEIPPEVRRIMHPEDGESPSVREGGAAH